MEYSNSSKVWYSKEFFSEEDLEMKGFIEDAVNSMCVEGKRQMDSKRFEFWIEALKYDQSDVVQELLEQCTPEGRNVLINGTFVYSKDCNHWLKFSVDACTNVIEGTRWFRPLTLLVSCRAMKTLGLLLSEPYCEITDVFVLDDGDSNILHALILSSQCTNLEDEYVAVYEYIMNALDFNTKKSLLMQENITTLRPLELCISCAQLGLFQSIFDETDIYRYHKGSLGMRRQVWYDITDYECWLSPISRRSKSPLELLSLLTNADLESTNARKFFSWPVLLTWSHVKYKMSHPLLILWFLWRVGVTATMYFVDPVLFTTNSTSSLNATKICDEMYKANLPISVIIVSYAISILFLDLIECIYYVKQKHVGRGDLLFKDYATHHGFYRFCVSALMLTAILRAFLGSDDVARHTTSWLLGILYTLSAIFNVWNLLYFLEMTPGFGILALSIQRMLAVMFRFTIAFLVLFFSFQYTFYRLFNEREVCHHGFEGFTDSIYSTFLIMVNMVDLAEILGGVDILLVIIHVTYVFLVVILLLNFLIALMSDAMSKVMNKADILVRLQQLSAALLVEERVGHLLNKMYGKFQRYYFKEDDDKLFLVCQY